MLACPVSVVTTRIGGTKVAVHPPVAKKSREAASDDDSVGEHDEDDDDDGICGTI